MISVDLESLALLTVAAFVLAAPIEYLCHRRGWGIGMRLLAWVFGVAIIGGLLMFNFSLDFGASFEEMCAKSDTVWASNCAGVKQVYISLLPVIGGLSLGLWSALYAVAAVVSRSIYRHALV
jgi:hypothetical protein